MDIHTYLVRTGFHGPKREPKHGIEHIFGRNIRQTRGTFELFLWKCSLSTLEISKRIYTYECELRTYLDNGLWVEKKEHEM